MTTYDSPMPTCPHDAPVAFECKSVHVPDVGLCDKCMSEWAAWHTRHGCPADTYSADPTPLAANAARPCLGFRPPGVKLAPFKPYEDPIPDKTRSTLGRLFGGDITE